LFFIPFSGKDAFLIPKAGLWTAALLVTLIYMAIAKHQTKQRIFQRLDSKIYVALALYLLIWVISAALSENKLGSIVGAPYYDGLAQLIAGLLTFLLIANHFQFKLKYMKYVLAVYCFISIFAVLQFYKLDPFSQFYGSVIKLSYAGQAFTTIGNQNHVSTCLSAVYIVSAFFYILGANVWKTKIAFLVPILIIFAGELATSTRSGLLAIGCVMLFTLPFVMKYKAYLRNYLEVCAASFSVYLVMDISSGGIIFGLILSIFSEGHKISAGNLDDDLGSGRMEIWKNSIALVKEYWLIGSGPDTFADVYSKFGFNAKDSFGNEIIPMIAIKAHNESLQLLITTGVFSLITYWTIVVSIVVKGVKKIKDNIYIIPFIMGLICYLIQGMLNSSIVPGMIIFWVLLALVFSSEKPAGEDALTLNGWSAQKHEGKE
jgi:putative inorganic carbon (HCO3(-)) transporter